MEKKMKAKSHIKPLKIGHCVLQIMTDLPDDITRCSHKIASGELVSVFVHSANYKFSLGSGSSNIVRMMIEDEESRTGGATLARAIQKIRKTPVGQCRVTKGGGFQAKAVSQQETDRRTSFDWIVHAVIPGPRIDGFQDRVTVLLEKILVQISGRVEKEDHLDLCLPVIGVNNFGYPVDFMIQLYTEKLVKFMHNPAVQGCIGLWVRRELGQRMYDSFREADSEKT